MMDTIAILVNLATLSKLSMVTTVFLAVQHSLLKLTVVSFNLYIAKTNQPTTLSRELTSL